MPDRCVDCGMIIEDDMAWCMPTAAIPDRCFYCSLGLLALDWVEYYMIASGLLQRRMRT